MICWNIRQGGEWSHATEVTKLVKITIHFLQCNVLKLELQESCGGVLFFNYIIVSQLPSIANCIPVVMSPYRTYKGSSVRIFSAHAYHLKSSFETITKSTGVSMRAVMRAVMYFF